MKEMERSYQAEESYKIRLHNESFDSAKGKYTIREKHDSIKSECARYESLTFHIWKHELEDYRIAHDSRMYALGRKSKTI